MTINTFDRPREAINLLKIFLSFGLEKLRIYPCKKKKKVITNQLLNLPF